MMSFKEIILVMIKRKKQLVALAIVFAVICGIYGGYNQLQTVSTDKEYKLELEKYENKKYDLEKRIDLLEKNIKQEVEYIDNAPYMQIKPYNHYKVIVNIKIGESPKDANKVYANYIKQIDEFTREVVDLKINNNGNITIEAISNSQKAAKKMVEGTINKILKENEIHIISEISEKTQDLDIAEKQQYILDKNTKNQTEYSNASSELTSLNKPINNRSVGAITKNIISFIILGFIIGIIIEFMICTFKQIVNKRILYKDQIEDNIGIQLIGDLFVPSTKIEKIYRTIDVGCNINYITIEEVCEVIDLYSKDLKSLLLVSTTEKNRYSHDIVEKLASNNIEAEYIEKILTNISKLKEYENIVLLEKRNESIEKNVVELVKIINKLEKKVIGYIIS